MPLTELNKPYKCPECGKPMIIMKGYFDWSFLPVEIITGEEKNDPEYDKTKHKSHLINCPKLQARWNTAVKKIQKDLNIREGFGVPAYIK